MKSHSKIFSQAVTGLVGAVITLVCTALIVLVPLRAQQAAPKGTLCGDSVCTCQGNMRHLGLALNEYAQDYDEKLPLGQQGPPDSGVGWFGPLSDYNIGRAYYHCPSDPTTATKPQYAFSYGYNANLPGTSYAMLSAPDLTVEAFELSGTAIYATQYDEGASQGAMVFSAASNGLDGDLLAGKNGTLVPGVTYATGYLGKRPPLSSGSQFPSASGRHEQGANYAFIDGHAQFFLPSDVSSGTDAPNSAAPQTGAVTGTAAGTMNNGYKVTFSAL